MPAPDHSAPSTPPRATPLWLLRIGQRLRRLLWLKAIGISSFIWIFFILYFELLRHPGEPVVTMPLTALDRWIGVWPSSLAAYFSLWLYVGVPPGLLLTFRQLVVYGLWAAAMCGVGLGIFLLWPTAAPAPEVDLSGYPGFALLRGIDAAGNACPSMHAAAATFAVIGLGALLRDVRAPAVVRALNIGWFLLILFSTLATRQHVVLDAVAGVLLGAVFGSASVRWRPLTPSAAYPPGYHGAQGASRVLAGAAGTRPRVVPREFGR